MPTIPVNQYEDLIRRSGIVEKDVLERALTKIHQKYGGTPPDSESIAKLLMEGRLITPWQNEQLMEGRHRGFFLGKYKLLAHISSGGMSEVYMGEQVMMRRRVAIKVFPTDLLEQSSYLDRFYLESRTQASLDHPNIVRAHDFGNEGRIHYLVMEYIEGEDLEHIVKKKFPLPYELAANYIQQAAEALSYAHSKNLVHRDIKPANLMLDTTGSLKLLDLGLARILGENHASLTIKHSENTLGTADYLSPEQAVDSHDVDARTDVYSLGGTMYYLFTGHPPFPEGTPVQRLMAHMNQEPNPVFVERPDAPPDLVAICTKMMAKKPADRFQSAGDVRDAVGTWMEMHGFTPPIPLRREVAAPEPQVPAERQRVVIPSGGVGANDNHLAPPPLDVPARSESNTPTTSQQPTLRSQPNQEAPKRQKAKSAAEHSKQPVQQRPASPPPAAEAPPAVAPAPASAPVHASPTLMGQVGEIGYGILLGAVAAVVVGVATQSGEPVTANNYMVWGLYGTLVGGVSGLVRVILTKVLLH